MKREFPVEGQIYEDLLRNLIASKYEVLELELMPGAGNPPTSYAVKCAIQAKDGKWLFKTSYADALLLQLDQPDVQEFILGDVEMFYRAALKDRETQATS